MKILILGGDGMLGHQLLLNLQKNHDVRVTLRQNKQAYQAYSFFNAENSYFGVDILRDTDLLHVLSEFRPQAVINAIGIVKQRKAGKEAIPNIEVNALFPHRLAILCKLVNARMIHMSTDCIFSGRKGKYSVEDSSDAEDLYGKNKFLGEVHDDHCVTLRTSIIGLELARKTSLIEWFLAQKGSVPGFKKAIYTGFTTLEMSRIIELILTKHHHLSGVWHVASDALSKYELLTTFSAILGRQDIQIEPNDDFFCDRSLIGNAFNKAIEYEPPSWKLMLEELASQVEQREATVCHV